MRARSGKQRFPVAQWVENLEALQSTTIAKHKKYAGRGHRLLRALPFSGLFTSLLSPRNGPDQQTESTSPEDSRRFGSRQGPGHTSSDNARESPVYSSSGIEEEESSEDYPYSPYGDQQRGNDNNNNGCFYQHTRTSSGWNGVFSVPDILLPPVRGSVLYSQPQSLSASGTSSPNFTQSGPNTPTENAFNLPPRFRNSSALSLLSVEGVIKEKQDLNLQNVSPFFTDAHGEYARQFEKKLAKLDGKNSESQLCIEECLSRSEKDWFNRYRDVKLGRTSMGTLTSSISRVKVPGKGDTSAPSSPTGTEFTLQGSDEDNKAPDEFCLPVNYAPPSGLKRFLLHRIGDWPLYSIILSFGQIIAANSYQVTLLNGEVGEPAEKLYIVATIYLVSSIIWWMVFRKLKSVFVLSIPFLVCVSPCLFMY